MGSRESSAADERSGMDCTAARGRWRGETCAYWAECDPRGWSRRMSRYAVDFADPKTGETRTITVELDERERRKSKDACADGTDPDGMMPLAYAMRHAFRAAPQGFVHIPNTIRALH